MVKLVLEAQRWPLRRAIADPLKGSELLRSACQLAGIRMLLSTDLPADLSKADVFVYLSESEGLGSATLLAMVETCSGDC